MRRKGRGRRGRGGRHVVPPAFSRSAGQEGHALVEVQPLPPAVQEGARVEGVVGSRGGSVVVRAAAVAVVLLVVRVVVVVVGPCRLP